LRREQLREPARLFYGFPLFAPRLTHVNSF
jgi:hypothetical protein